MLLSALADLQYFRGKELVDREVFRTLGNSLTIKEKIEWTVKLYDANYFIDKRVRQKTISDHSLKSTFIILNHVNHFKSRISAFEVRFLLKKWNS